MQYCSAVILLHRPSANFGTGTAGCPPSESRNICIENATSIAQFLQEYRSCHGDATTLSGVALHTIATAATTLIADIAERKESGASSQLLSLKACVRTLGELEQTYIVARRVRRIIQLVMRLCQLDFDKGVGQQVTPPVEVTPANRFNRVDMFSSQDLFGEMSMGDSSLAETPFLGCSPFSLDEFLPLSSQSDILYPLEM